MLRLLVIFFLLLSCVAEKEPSGEELYEVIVKKVDLNILTTYTVKCNDFEEVFEDEFQRIEIRDEKQMSRFSDLVAQLEVDPEGYTPDVRAKVLLFYKHKVDTLCLSKLGILLNGKPMQANKELVLAHYLPFQPL